MSSRKQKRVADKVVRVYPVAKIFLKQYIARIQLERGEDFTEAQVIDEIFERCEPALWQESVRRAQKSGNGNDQDDGGK